MSWKTGGGGALLDISHEIDYLMWLFGDISYVQGYSMTISDLEITSDDYTVVYLSLKMELWESYILDLLQPEESRYMRLLVQSVMIVNLMTNTLKFNTIENTEWVSESYEVNWDEVYKKKIAIL